MKKYLLASSAMIAAASLGAHTSVAQDELAAEPTDDVIRVAGFRSSLSDSLQGKREANQLVDLITSEEIGQFPDQNIAEAIQRIAGVQITRNNGEGETVNIRGLSANFTRIEVDGRSTNVTIDSSDPERQSVLSVFASDLYNTIEVIKSPTAADIEGGVGGIVRLKTPNPLDIGELAWGLDAGLTDADTRDDTEPSINGFYSNVFADGRIGVLVAGTYEERDRSIDKFQSNQNWRTIGGGQIVDDADPALLALVGARYPGRLRQEQREGEAPKYNINAKLQWQVTPDLVTYVDTVFTSEEREEDRDRLQIQFSRGDLVSGERQGDTLVSGVFDGSRTEYASFARRADITTSGLTAGFDLDLSDWALGGEVSQSQSEEDLTEFRASHRDNNDPNAGYSIVNDPEYPEIFSAEVDNDLADIGTRQLDQERRIINIEETSARFDAERTFTSGAITSVEAGVRYATTEFDRRQGFASSPGAGTATYADGASPFVVDGGFAEDFGGAGVLRVWPSVDPVSLLNAFPIDGGVSFNDANLYTITEDVWAVYGMGNFEAEPFGLFARGNVGARVVMTDYSGQGRVRAIDENEAVTLFDDAAALEQDYTDVLPAFNVVVSQAQDSDVLVRAAITRALSRPEVEQLNPSISINAAEEELSRGNPDLDPFRAWQYDLGVEWYFGDSGESAVTASVFFKDIESFVFADEFDLVDATFAEFGLATPTTYQVSTFTNGGDASVQGVELGLQTPFTFLPGPLADFGGFVNYTYTDSEFTNDDGVSQPFPGASENAFNIVGYYERGGFSGRLAYNYRDEFLIVPAQTNGGTANAEFGDAQGRVDLALRYRFDNGLRVSFDALNLTEEQNYKYYDTTQRLEDLEVEGRIYQFRVGYVY